MCGDSYFAFKWYMEFMKHKTKIIANARNALSVWLCVLIIFQQQKKSTFTGAAVLLSLCEFWATVLSNLRCNGVIITEEKLKNLS